MLRFNLIFAICLTTAWPMVCLGEPGKTVTVGRGQPGPIQRWIEQLEHEKFKIREEATKKLIEAGPRAIGSATRAAIKGRPETSGRAMTVLITIFESGQPSSFLPARKALLEVAESKQRAVAQQARGVLVRYQEASLQMLRELGAIATHECREIVLGGSRWTGGGQDLVYLNGLVRIERLKIWQADVDDAALSNLENLIHLEELWLADTRITDRGLAKLSRMKNLTVLNLRFTEISDRGLSYLFVLRRLKQLDLRDTEVTPAGVDQLKRRLPGLVVVF
ncbi:MAG: hypothetical protein IID44_32545 [Planctomycetes bacterium]|nr:hypothetical protein [Planctomycetota bacterium]